MTTLNRYKALITAGGIGTRLLPFSKEIPKEMFPIITKDGGGAPLLKPLVQAIFEQLYSAGVRNFYVVVGRGKRAIEDHFTVDPGFLELLKQRGRDAGCLAEYYGKVKSSNLVFINQPEPLGFGDAVLLGRPHIRGTFIVQAGDTFILSEGDGYLSRLLRMHQRYGASATVLLQDVPDPRQYGVVEGDSLESGVLMVREAVEKPEEPKSRHAIMPVYLFTDEVFNALSEIKPGRGGELQLTDAIQRLVTTGKRVVGVRLRSDEIRLDLGSPETMIEALRLSLENLGGREKRPAEGYPRIDQSEYPWSSSS